MQLGGLRRSRCIRQYNTQSLADRLSDTQRLPIIDIKRATFYRHHLDSHHAASNSNPALFKDMHFHLNSAKHPDRRFHWAIIGPSNSGKTTLLQILRGQHLSTPPEARSYPFLDQELYKLPHQAIKLVGFDGEQGLGTQAPQSAYLSARYESRREGTDYSVLDYLKGNTELNPFHEHDTGEDAIQISTLEQVISDLNLSDLVDMPVSNLSNGQTRRARIAKALLSNPEVLLLDEPFMGLDPPTLKTLSPLLKSLATNRPRIVLTLRPQDPIPDWITHVVFLTGSCEVAVRGQKNEVLKYLRHEPKSRKRLDPKVLFVSRPPLQIPAQTLLEIGRTLTSDGIQEYQANLAMKSSQNPKDIDWKPMSSTSDSNIREPIKMPSGSSHNPPKGPLSRDGYNLEGSDSVEIGEALVEMEGARVTYGTKSVLGNWTQDFEGSSREGLWWTVRRGERWGVFGPNGSGKTTILSLICSDHPQTYSLPIRLFGRSRLPEKGETGISIFDIQARIGHSSPEIHNHIPKSLTLRKVLLNAWSDTFRGLPKHPDNERIDACLRWFEHDLRPQGNRTLDTMTSRIEPDVNWADDLLFGGLPFSAQRVALFIRAIIKQPDLVILDEAFSGMDDRVRDRCLLFLAHGETKDFSKSSLESKARPQIVESEISKSGQVKLGGLKKEQALICISHVREEIPGSIREWICLPEANTGKPARFGRLDGPIEGNYARWNEIWGM